MGDGEGERKVEDEEEGEVWGHPRWVYYVYVASL